jgi:CRP-like cAMP-binding protein
MESINFQISDNLCKKYSFLIRSNELPVSYYRYVEKKMLSDFDYFGESYFGNYKEKIVSKTNNLELLYFKNDIYNEYELNMKLKYAGTQDQFLLNNFFLNSIAKSIFEKVYLKYFEYIKFFANQTIIEENEPISYIYFIKSGNVKLYSNRSIIQNHLLIQIIINILKQKCPNIDTKNSFYKSYSDLTVNFDKIKEEMEFNRNIHLMNFNQKQCIGFECFYFGFNSLYTAKAISEKVEVYRISIERLYKILSIKNKKALYDFAMQAEKALKILLDRLMIVNNMLILNYSQKNKNVLKEASDYMEREILLNQIKLEEMRGIMNIKNSRIKEQKKFEQSKSSFDFNYFSNKNISIKEKHALLSCPKRRNTRLDLKKNFKFDRNKLIQKMALTGGAHKILDNLGINYKLYNTKETLARQRSMELLRESCELERLSNQEKKKIHYLKLQNQISKDFVRLSKGEKRIFINSSNSMNLSTIPHHYSFRKRNIFLISKNKFKTSKPLDKNMKKREFFPKLHKTEDKSTNIESNNDIALNGKWIQLNQIKSIENSSINSEREIYSKERVNVFKKSTEGNSNIYKKYIIKDIYK